MIYSSHVVNAQLKCRDKYVCAREAQWLLKSTQKEGSCLLKVKRCHEEEESDIGNVDLMRADSGISV